MQIQICVSNLQGLWGVFASGQQVQCRIEKDHMFVSSGQGKELKLSIIGSAVAQ
jgi:hypothetical protein